MTEKPDNEVSGALDCYLSFTYLRDDHCFARLSVTNVESFIGGLRWQWFEEGQSYGMLCGYDRGEHISESVHGGPLSDWDRFESECRKWFELQHSRQAFDPIALGC